VAVPATAATVFITPDGVSTNAVYNDPTGEGGFDGPNGGTVTDLDIGFTVNGFINRQDAADTNDGIRFDTTMNGVLNPVFNYEFTVSQNLGLVAFELFPTVGGLTAEEVRAYSVTISNGSTTVFSGSVGTPGDSSAGDVGVGNSLDVVGTGQIFTPGNTYSVVVTDLSGQLFNREFSEVRINFDDTVVPEPTTVLSFLLGGVTLLRRRR